MNPSRAILLLLTSIAVFIAMQSLIKATSGHIPPGEAVFFRSFFALPVILGWLGLTGRLATGLRTQNPIGHFWRGLVGTSAMGLSFAALGLLPLPEVTAISYAAPVLTVIFAAMFLGEKVGLVRLSAVAMGLVGVAIILAPRLGSLSGSALDWPEAMGALMALMAATFAAMAKIFLRRLVASEHPATIVFYFSMMSTLLSLTTIPFGWVIPTGREALFLVLAGLAGGLGQGFLTSAYRHADASFIAPFDYASILFALAVGYFVFAEVPTLAMLAGAALVVGAGIWIILRERARGIAHARQRQARTPGAG